MERQKKKVIGLCTAILFSCSGVAIPLLSTAGNLPPEKLEEIVEFNGQKFEFDLGLSNTITKIETTQEEYDSTCYRQEPDGTETKCETLYRDEQQCGNENVCHDEQECSTEYKCHDEYRCHDEQDCGYHNVCHPEQVCKTDRQCHVENRCHTEQDCSGSEQECKTDRQCHVENRCHTEQDCSGSQRECKTDRDCHVVDGKRVCEEKQVCSDRPVCRPKQECSQERVCEDRPVCVTRPVCRSHEVCHPERECEDRQVCTTENRCSNEYSCETRQRCGTEQECRNENVCHTVPRCGTEYVCHTVQVPYQDCRQVPKYKSVPYACKKTRPIQNTVLDYIHKADVKVMVDAKDFKSGLDKFRVSFEKEKLAIEAKDAKSGLAYFVRSEVKTTPKANQQVTTAAVLRVSGVDKTSLVGKLQIKDLKADKKGLSFVRGDVSNLAGFKLSYVLKVQKLTDDKAVIINRALQTSEYSVDPKTGEVSITFDKLGIYKSTKKKGEYSVVIRSALALADGAEWIKGSTADTFSEQEAKFKVKGLFGFE